jgi:acyl carrier protein
MDEKFLSLVSITLNIPKEKLTYESTAESFPQWTSLSHWELIEAIESAYHTEFTMDEATEFKNLGDLFEVLKNKLP